MKQIILFFIIYFSVSAHAHEEITFEIENLSKPKELLPVLSIEKIYQKLILSDVDMYSGYLEENSRNFPFGIIAKSEVSDSLVNFKYNSFFYGMYQAYAEHRPFVLSPDIVWLLITQGFARHINANQEMMRNYFVDFSGKLSLVVRTNKSLDDPALSWNDLFSGFTEQIDKHVGNDLTKILSCNFSTTTPIEKVASEITVMEAMKPYFEFIVMSIVCGIPEITIKGTPNDWRMVLDKAKELKQYELDWWISELEPILKEFVKASEGKVNKKFWRNMFKYHSQKKYGAPNIIDGWIVRFFPYGKEGKRNNLRKLEGGQSLPDEIVKVDLTFIESYIGNQIITPLELWAGIIGLEQNKDNFSLTPQIGWMIRKKDIEQVALKKKLEIDSQDDCEGISIRVKEFPLVLLSFEEIKRIEIEFIDEINIPDEFARVRVGILDLSGNITKKGIERIKGMFPNSEIRVNGEFIGEEEKLY
ncbi:MAG: DUF4419 domain-containing protein [Bacteroidales bacterium]|nr:DUF4419 domain-containing protein [Bacteroidales bacterium]